MNSLLRVDVEYSEEPVEACDGKVGLISQAVDASNGANAALVLAEHAAMLGPEIEKCKIASSATNQNLKRTNLLFWRKTMASALPFYLTFRLT
jgi:hypothetical protein